MRYDKIIFFKERMASVILASAAYIYFLSTLKAPRQIKITVAISRHIPKPCTTLNCEMLMEWYDDVLSLINPISQPCKYLRGVGEDDTTFRGWQGQGPYMLCFDEPYRLAPGNCLVYSFGINEEWSFDDAMALEFNCRVYSFDPTMAKSAHIRESGVQFYPFGIHSKNEVVKPLNVNYYENKNQENFWTMKNLQGIAEFFNHTTEIIDVLKIDVEQAEYDALAAAMDDGFLQNRVASIVIEWHIFPINKLDSKTRKRYIEIYRRLHDEAGFKVAYSRQRQCCDETFLNVETLINQHLFAH